VAIETKETTMTIETGDTYTTDSASGKEITNTVTRVNDKSVWYDWKINGKFINSFRVSRATWTKEKAEA
jgi:hypothetical protein